MGASWDQVSRCSRYAARISWSRFDPSLEAEPSTASPTGTPSRSISGIRQTPLASFILDTGQWATPVPVSARRRSSSSLKWMPWANQTSSPSQPQEAI